MGKLSDERRARWDEKAGLPGAVGKFAARTLRARGPEGRPAVRKRSTVTGGTCRRV